LVGGIIWSNVKKLVKDGTFEVEISQAVCGIKGTTFVLSDDGKTSTIKVIEGVVEYKSKATGKSVLVKQGEMATATSNGLGAVKSFDVAAEKKIWKEVKNKAIADTPMYEQKLEALEDKAASSANNMSSVIALSAGAVFLAAAGYFVLKFKGRKAKRLGE
jgi:ferric-dicitrate binding protein FerR (iron transport regulator)